VRGIRNSHDGAQGEQHEEAVPHDGLSVPSTRQQPGRELKALDDAEFLLHAVHALNSRSAREWGGGDAVCTGEGGWAGGVGDKSSGVRNFPESEVDPLQGWPGLSWLVY